MPDDKNEASGFKVVDKRSFSEDGTPRGETPEPIKRPEAAAASSGPAVVPDESSLDEFAEEGPSGFGMLVSYLSTTAMFQLGMLPGPAGERIPVDLVNAHMTIDLLEVLQEKTQGNLTPDEAKMLEDVLYELRMTFVEIQKRATQKTK
ncbi:MAG: DUF1844 domain-containing protein [Terriglobia bacterium]